MLHLCAIKSKAKNIVNHNFQATQSYSSVSFPTSEPVQIYIIRNKLVRTKKKLNNFILKQQLMQSKCFIKFLHSSDCLNLTVFSANKQFLFENNLLWLFCLFVGLFSPYIHCLTLAFAK